MSTTGLMISLFDMASLPTMFPVVFRSENEWWNPHQTNPDIPITMVIHPFHHFRHWFETMVKSPFFWWKINKFLWWQKKTNLGKFIFHGKIIIICGEKINLGKFISHGKITFLCGEKTNLAKFISHGKITFLCGEKNKSC